MADWTTPNQEVRAVIFSLETALANYAAKFGLTEEARRALSASRRLPSDSTDQAFERESQSSLGGQKGG